MSNATLRLVFAVLASATATLSGCGSVALDRDQASDDPLAPRPVDSASGLEPVPLEQLAERLSDALCQGLDSCCQAAALGSAGADCKERNRAGYQSQLTASSARAVRYDPIAAARCVAAFAHFLGGCSYEGKAASDAACAGMFRGTQALDESCQSDSECAPTSGAGVYCEGNLGLSPNTCQPTLLANEQCLLEGCAKGLFCELGTLSCQPQHASGGCLQFEECTEDSVCSPNALCEAKLYAGEPCVIDLQCRSGVCSTSGACADAIATASTCVSL